MLEMNAKSDCFMTTSSDLTLRIWNLNATDTVCDFIYDVSNGHKVSSVCGNFDPSNKITIVATNFKESKTRFSLLDNSKLEESAPFVEEEIPDISDVTSIKFSPNGEYFACSTSDNSIVVLDAYAIKVVCRLPLANQEQPSSYFGAYFSPDSRYLLAGKSNLFDIKRFMYTGTENGSVLVWNMTKPTEPLLVLEKKVHIKPCMAVKFSYNSVLMCSGCQNLVMWLPNKFE